jgi:hypothetical protein
MVIGAILDEHCFVNNEESSSLSAIVPGGSFGMMMDC